MHATKLIFSYLLPHLVVIHHSCLKGIVFQLLLDLCCHERGLLGIDVCLLDNTLNDVLLLRVESSCELFVELGLSLLKF